MAATEPTNVDLTLINLSRLLSRLSSIILSPGPENELLEKSNLERRRVGANLDYARTLLLQLEQQSFGIKAQNRRHALQAELADKKDVLGRLNERLYHYNEVGDEDDEPGNPDGEDLLDEDAADHSRRASRSGLAPNGVDAEVPLNSSLDRRKPFSADPDGHLGDSGSLSNGSTLLNGPQKAKSTAAKDVGLTTSSKQDGTVEQVDKLLSFNRSEQEDLTESLLGMAQALKASSEAFATSLESEKEVLDRASDGLEANATGMQVAEKRMGTLRRMTEGRGWIGRLLMYAWIAGLWLLALIIVVVLPKFRF